jgi:hypothetical protein
VAVPAAKVGGALPWPGGRGVSGITSRGLRHRMLRLRRRLAAAAAAAGNLWF